MNQASRLSSESREEEGKSLLAEFPQSTDQRTYSDYHSRRTFRSSVIIPWLISFILSACLVIQQAKTRSSSCSPDLGYWKTWEVEPATKEILPTLKEVKFTAGLHFNESGGLERVIDPALPAYVGVPTPKMDALWHDLTETIDIFLTEQEAEAMGGDMTVDPESGLYMGEIQMTHDIHCLNMIRMALQPDHYPEQSVPSLAAHLDHCIDALRQSLMCAGDLTIIKSSWSNNRGAMMPEFQNYHTCRDFDAIKGWARGRNAADPKLWRENAAKLLAGESH